MHRLITVMTVPSIEQGNEPTSIRVQPRHEHGLRSIMAASAAHRAMQTWQAERELS
jgi:hypothetical protein